MKKVYIDGRDVSTIHPTVDHLPFVHDLVHVEDHKLVDTWLGEANLRKLPFPSACRASFQWKILLSDYCKGHVLALGFRFRFNYTMGNLQRIDIDFTFFFGEHIHGGSWWEILENKRGKSCATKMNEWFLTNDLMGQQATPCGWNKPRLVSRKWKLNIDVKGKPPFAVASRGIFPVSKHFSKMKVTWAASVFLCSTLFNCFLLDKVQGGKPKHFRGMGGTFNMLLWVLSFN